MNPRRALWLAFLVGACGSDPISEGSLPPLPATQTCTFEGTAPGFVPVGDLQTFGQIDTASAIVALEAASPDGAVALSADGVVYEVDRGGDARVLLDASAAVEEAFDLARAGTDLFLAFAPSGRSDLFRVVRFDGSAGTFDATAGRQILEERTPNGGTLAVAPDGMLLVGVGDADVDGLSSVAMDRTDRRGKILRVDASDPAGGFSIPPDNPVLVDGGPSAIYALGVRAPRGLTAELGGGGRTTFVDHGLTADELDILRPGRNYGWPRLDGRSCHVAPAGCSPFEYEGATFVRAREESGCALLAGAIIGAGGGAYAGGLLYGDGCGPGIAGFLLDGYRVHEQRVTDLAAPLSAVGRGASGGALVVDAAGSVIEVVPRPDVQPFPTTLSEARCFADLGALTPLASVVPYDLNAPLFTDGSDKRRFIALPVGRAITVADDGTLEFPVGSVLLKVFSYGQPVETRVLVLRDDGWEAHTYRWNDAATDAVLLEDSEDLMVEVDLPGGRAVATHLFPDRQGCAICHGFRPQRHLGPRLDQLSRRVDLDSGPADQLQAFADIGLFGGASLPDLAPMPDPLDETESLASRARAYLHTNCGHCHRPDGWVPPDLTMDLRYHVPLAETAACDVPSDYAPSPIDRIEPGDPDGSLIYVRMTTDGVDRMPPLGTSLVDDVGSAVVRDWIAALSGCD